ncbi:AAA family ATPase [Candidatus Woesearchaeota archaeon]|nr:AAA family ATPase [Candidatus Woesearchaeota archaeon]
MSEFNIIWRNYGLSDNPYFHYPLTMQETNIPLQAFVGREKERGELKRIIELGGDVRYMVVGEPGIGKTSLINYVKSEASKYRFFTPKNEMEISRIMSGNEFIILTISSIYTEIKNQKLPLTKELSEKLDALYELTQYGDMSNDIANLTQLNRQKLVDLYKKLIEEIINSGFQSIIIHYDNLDEIKDFDELADMLGDVRDFLMQKKIIFLFVGDRFLPQSLLTKKRVRDIFLSPSLELEALSFNDIMQLLDKRINYFKIKDMNTIIPHTKEAVKILFEIHEGNIRDILNGLSTCISSLPRTNTPIQITDEILKDVLYKKIEDKIISRLTKKEKDILLLIAKHKFITPTEIASKVGVKIQNVSSKYLTNLKLAEAVRERGKEGRNIFYEITPPIKWWKLKRDENEIIESKLKNQKRIQTLIQEFES